MAFTARGIIRDRRAEIANGSTGAKDLLALLLEAQPSGVQINDELIRDEATTFLLGGHETTASTDVAFARATSRRGRVAGKTPGS
jgi:cytochrome P450